MKKAKVYSKKVTKVKPIYGHCMAKHRAQLLYIVFFEFLFLKSYKIIKNAFWISLILTKKTLLHIKSVKKTTTRCWVRSNITTM